MVSLQPRPLPTNLYLLLLHKLTLAQLPPTAPKPSPTTSLHIALLPYVFRLLPNLPSGEEDISVVAVRDTRWLFVVIRRGVVNARVKGTLERIVPRSF